MIVLHSNLIYCYWGRIMAGSSLLSIL